MIPIILVGLVLFILVIGYMYREAQSLQLKEEVLHLPDWPEGFEGIRILFISDLHRRVIPKPIRKILLERKIDLVLLGGDITEKYVPLDRVRENVQFLSSLAPAYFVWGNHDYKVDFRELDLMLREEKVVILDNRSVAFEAGNDRLWLIGVDDVSLKRDQLSLALLDIEQPGYRLLLSHNPEIIEKLTGKEGIRGVLSGHTHGGQINLPILGPPVKFIKKGFPKYYSGTYQIQRGPLKLKLFVSNGVGTTRLPLRLFAPPELHLLTLKAE